MRKNKEYIPLMQLEVWRMKDKVRQDTKEMDCNKYFQYIRDKGKNFFLKSTTPFLSISR